MTADSNALVPVWTLATEDVIIPNVFGDEGMTAARLAELRTVLATMAAVPIVTLEAHPISTRSDRTGGIALHAASPLAQQLSQLVAQTAKSTPAGVDVAAAGEVLYRMVVPAKVAAQVGKGLVKPMASKAVAGGIHSALKAGGGAGKIAANATFVPVAAETAAAGAAAGSAVTAGAAVAAAGVLTVAAPLVLMAVAVGVSAYADYKRQQAIERITDLLKQLHDDKLEHERAQLAGCRNAITKATSILLDQGSIGFALGLDSAVHAIDVSIEETHNRLAKWEDALSALPEGSVELGALEKEFPGIGAGGGEFRANLEVAHLAIALKRRVLILQAVEHAQLAGADHPFKSFIRTLQEDERRVDELASGIDAVLLQLSSLELKPRAGFPRVMFTKGQVDELLEAAYRLRALGDDVNMGTSQADVAIEIERSSDGSLVVFPAVAA